MGSSARDFRTRPCTCSREQSSVTAGSRVRTAGLQASFILACLFIVTSSGKAVHHEERMIMPTGMPFWEGSESLPFISGVSSDKPRVEGGKHEVPCMPPTIRKLLTTPHCLNTAWTVEYQESCQNGRLSGVNESCTGTIQDAWLLVSSTTTRISNKFFVFLNFSLPPEWYYSTSSTSTLYSSTHGNCFSSKHYGYTRTKSNCTQLYSKPTAVAPTGVAVSIQWPVWPSPKSVIVVSKFVKESGASRPGVGIQLAVFIARWLVAPSTQLSTTNIAGVKVTELDVLLSPPVAPRVECSAASQIFIGVPPHSLQAGIVASSRSGALGGQITAKIVSISKSTFVPDFNALVKFELSDLCRARNAHGAQTSGGTCHTRGIAGGGIIYGISTSTKGFCYWYIANTYKISSPYEILWCGTFCPHFSFTIENSLLKQSLWENAPSNQNFECDRGCGPHCTCCHTWRPAHTFISPKCGPELHLLLDCDMAGGATRSPYKISSPYEILWCGTFCPHFSYSIENSLLKQSIWENAPSNQKIDCDRKCGSHCTCCHTWLPAHTYISAKCGPELYLPIDCNLMNKVPISNTISHCNVCSTQRIGRGRQQNRINVITWYLAFQFEFLVRLKLQNGLFCNFNRTKILNCNVCTSTKLLLSSGTEFARDQIILDIKRVGTVTTTNRFPYEESGTLLYQTWVFESMYEYSTVTTTNRFPYEESGTLLYQTWVFESMYEYSSISVGVLIIVFFAFKCSLLSGIIICLSIFPCTHGDFILRIIHSVTLARALYRSKSLSGSVLNVACYVPAFAGTVLAMPQGGKRFSNLPDWISAMKTVMIDRYLAKSGSERWYKILTEMMDLSCYGKTIEDFTKEKPDGDIDQLNAELKKLKTRIEVTAEAYKRALSENIEAGDDVDDCRRKSKDLVKLRNNLSEGETPEELRKELESATLKQKAVEAKLLASSAKMEKHDKSLSSLREQEANLQGRIDDIKDYEEQAEATAKASTILWSYLSNPAVFQNQMKAAASAGVDKNDMYRGFKMFTNVLKFHFGESDEQRKSKKLQKLSDFRLLHLREVSSVSAAIAKIDALRSDHDDLCSADSEKLGDDELKEKLKEVISNVAFRTEIKDSQKQSYDEFRNSVLSYYNSIHKDQQPALFDSIYAATVAIANLAMGGGHGNGNGGKGKGNRRAKDNWGPFNQRPMPTDDEIAAMNAGGENNADRTNATCAYCRKQGHFARDSKNKRKCPGLEKWEKSQKKKGKGKGKRGGGRGGRGGRGRGRGHIASNVQGAFFGMPFMVATLFSGLATVSATMGADSSSHNMVEAKCYQHMVFTFMIFSLTIIYNNISCCDGVCTMPQHLVHGIGCMIAACCAVFSTAVSRFDTRKIDIDPVPIKEFPYEKVEPARKKKRNRSRRKKRKSGKPTGLFTVKGGTMTWAWLQMLPAVVQMVNANSGVGNDTLTNRLGTINPAFFLHEEAGVSMLAKNSCIDSNVLYLDSGCPFSTSKIERFDHKHVHGDGTIGLKELDRPRGLVGGNPGQVAWFSHYGYTKPITLVDNAGNTKQLKYKALYSKDFPVNLYSLTENHTNSIKSMNMGDYHTKDGEFFIKYHDNPGVSKSFKCKRTDLPVFSLERLSDTTIAQSKAIEPAFVQTRTGAGVDTPPPKKPHEFLDTSSLDARINNHKGSMIGKFDPETQGLIQPRSDKRDWSTIIARLGHASPRVCKNILSPGGPVPTGVSRIAPRGKARLAPANKNRKSVVLTERGSTKYYKAKNTPLFEEMGLDYTGPFQNSIFGNVGAFVYVEAHSQLVWCHFVSNKTSANAARGLKMFMKKILRMGSQEPKRIACDYDAGPMAEKQAFYKHVVEDMGADIQPGAPYSISQRNHQVEGLIGVLKQHMVCILEYNSSPRALWEPALENTCKIMNCIRRFDNKQACELAGQPPLGPTRFKTCLCRAAVVGGPNANLKSKKQKETGGPTSKTTDMIYPGPPVQGGPGGARANLDEFIPFPDNVSYQIHGGAITRRNKATFYEKELARDFTKVDYGIDFINIDDIDNSSHILDSALLKNVKPPIQPSLLMKDHIERLDDVTVNLATIQTLNKTIGALKSTDDFEALRAAVVNCCEQSKMVEQLCVARQCGGIKFGEHDTLDFDDLPEWVFGGVGASLLATNHMHGQRIGMKVPKSRKDMQKLFENNRVEYNPWAKKYIHEYDRRIESHRLLEPVAYKDIVKGAGVLQSFGVTSWKSILDGGEQKIERKVRIVANGAQQASDHIDDDDTQSAPGTTNECCEIVDAMSVNYDPKNSFQFDFP